LVGIGLGVALLRVLEAGAVKPPTSLVVTGFAAAIIGGWTPRGMGSRLAPGIVGTLSGTLGAMTGRNGRPVVLLFVARGYEVQAFRAGLITYFLLVNMVAVSARVWAGETRWTDIQAALLLLPAAIVGTTVGRRIVHYVPLAAFRRFVLMMALVAGLTGVASAVPPWLV
jgi:uncharacterized membrane protein YfcA